MAVARRLALRASPVVLAAYAVPLLTLLALAGLVAWHGPLYYDPSAPAERHDHFRYIAMAANPFAPSGIGLDPPYCWRILTPLIVHYLPVPTLTGFWLLTCTGLALAVVGLVWCLRGLGLSPATALAGGLAFVLLGPATGFELWDYMLTDPLTLALLAWIVALAVRRMGAPLLVLLPLMALSKETAIMAGIFAVLWAAEKRDRRLAVFAAAGLVAAVGVLVGLRIAIRPGSGYSLGSDLVRGFLLFVLQPAWGLYRLTSGTAPAWYLLLPIALLQLTHPPRLLRSPAWGWLLLSATAQILIASDGDRLVVCAFPAVIAAVCFEMSWLAARLQVSGTALWSLLLAVQALFWIPYGMGLRGNTNAIDFLGPPGLALFYAIFVTAATTFIFALYGPLRSRLLPALSGLRNLV